ncbi:hypothetical protein ACN27F_05095 [Solwaraspora sp. WMMB335]|uniref:hypothetical protein n=1 Tax=Solwaraspora sp. WMMB335 TaxID=3404118 RepID=UPI003B94CD14
MFDWLSTDRTAIPGRSADGGPRLARETFWMRPATGFLSTRQRRFAWLGFVLAALQAPLSAYLLTDGSWLFSVCVALMVATVILADDAMRRRPAEADRRVE